MNRFFLLALLALTSFSTAHAAEDDADFHNYNTMLKRLKSEGIEDSQVRWPSIEKACVAYLGSLNKIPYNRCRYEKAVLQISFKDDSIACDDVSLASHPDSLRQNSATIVEKTGGAVSRKTTISTPSPSASELATMRRATYEQCMQDRGWRDSRNYLRGRSEN